MAFVAVITSVALLLPVTFGVDDATVLTVVIAPSRGFHSWPGSEGGSQELLQEDFSSLVTNISGALTTSMPDHIIDETHLLDFYNKVYSQSSALIVFIDLRHQACPIDLFRQRLLAYITMSTTHCPSLSEVVTRATLTVNTWSLHLMMFMSHLIESWAAAEKADHFHSSFVLFFDRSGEDYFLLQNRFVTNKHLFEVTMPLTDCRSSDDVTQIAAQMNTKDAIVVALSLCVYDLILAVSRLHLPTTRFRWLLYPTDLNETFEWNGADLFFNSAFPIFLTERGRPLNRPVYSHAKLLQFTKHATTSFLSALTANGSAGTCNVDCTSNCTACQAMFGEMVKEIPGQMYEVYTPYSQPEKRAVTFELMEFTSTGFTKLGNWSQDAALSVDRIVYPPDFIDTRLSVVVVVEPPFVFRNESENGDTTYYGYSIDVLKAISGRLKFFYTVSECDSGGYGVMYGGKWTGCIGNVVRGEADVILGALTMTAERDQVIDFSLPYYSFAGIQILMKKQTGKINLFYYSDVFTTPAWLSLTAVVAVTCILLWVYERITSPDIREASYTTTRQGSNSLPLHINATNLEMSTVGTTKNLGSETSNGWSSIDGSQVGHVTSVDGLKVRSGLVKIPNPEKMDALAFPETAYTCAESSWYVIGALAMAGGGDPPRSFSGRILVAGFWFFSVIMMSTFTANLAAFLTMSRMGNTISSMDDLARQTDVKYAVVNQTNVMEYFHRMANIERNFYETWKNNSLDRSADSTQDSYAVWDYPLGNKYDAMWTNIKQSGLLQSNQEGLDRVLSENFALITESPLIQYYTGKNCDLTSVGEQFSIRPYAIGLTKRSPYVKKFSDAILKLQKDRELAPLLQRWWQNNDVSCPKDTGNKGLDLYSLSGTFIIAGTGVGCGLIMLLLEHLVTFVKKRQRFNSRKINGPVLPGK